MEFVFSAENCDYAKTLLFASKTRARTVSEVSGLGFFSRQELCFYYGRFRIPLQNLSEIRENARDTKTATAPREKKQTSAAEAIHGSCFSTENNVFTVAVFGSRSKIKGTLTKKRGI